MSKDFFTLIEIFLVVYIESLETQEAVSSTPLFCLKQRKVGFWSNSLQSLKEIE